MDFEEIDIFEADTKIEDTARAMVEENLRNNRYTPLSKKHSKAIRAYYHRGIKIPITGQEGVNFFTKCGTLVATGYVRVVIGDYGAYIEFESRHIKHDVIMQRYPGEPNRPVKYIWKVVKDVSQTKVYEQRGTVEYADYKIGMYYMGVGDLEAR